MTGDRPGRWSVVYAPARRQDRAPETDEDRADSAEPVPAPAGGESASEA
ncbi:MULTISPECIES: hypothetical protein [Actinosynnema]|nr:hypothetical protein [Actinosynnema pretiosum]MCP2092692.1 hypothetical protein [Actinosynnema pretiosum]